MHELLNSEDRCHPWERATLEGWNRSVQLFKNNYKGTQKC